MNKQQKIEETANQDSTTMPSQKSPHALFIVFAAVACLSVWYMIVAVRYVFVPLSEKTDQTIAIQETIQQSSSWDTIQQPITTDTDVLLDNTQDSISISGLANQETWQTQWQIQYPQKICIKNTCFSIEIASTQEQRAIWLMNRTFLEQDAWMLFVFEQPGTYNFWMKNTLIPLDIIRLDEDLYVQHIKHEAMPCTRDICPSYWWEWIVSLYVLEVAWWVANTLWLEIWDKLSFIW